MKQGRNVTAGGLVDDVPRRRRKSFLRRRKVQRRVLPWVVIILLFVLWEIVVRLFGIEQFLLPAPSAIFQAGWQWRWPILDNAWQTFMTTAVGFFIAVAFGLLAGIAIATGTFTLIARLARTYASDAAIRRSQAPSP